MNFPKFKRIMAITALTTCLATSAVFAQVNVDTTKANNTPPNKIESNEDRELREKDPIKYLEKMKQKVQTLLKEGKITKEEADRINAKIDEKIKMINEFNQLPLDKKREKLLSNLKDHLEKKVKEGKLTKNQMNKIMKEYEKKVKEWDGNGFPPAPFKRCKPKDGHKCKRS
ncbi:MAG TPA: hypothetical protein GXX36_06740 [Clostridiaceae bacterium]|nr:hypothetical protein [Clostridiaceae bacterium]